MAYIARVRPRWSDMDLFGHVNHAKLVTLIEEARVPLLFEEAVGAGLTEMAKGIVVARLEVRYRAPIIVEGEDIRMEISLSDLKFSTFTLGCKVHNGPSESDGLAAEAEVVLAPFDLERQRPRRLSVAEREFLVDRLGGSGRAGDVGRAGSSDSNGDGKYARG